MTALGWLALAFSAIYTLPMFQTVSGFTHVSAGGGEYFVGLFFALPLLLLSGLLLGICALKRAWRSRAASWGLALFAVGIAVWVYMFIVDGMR